MDTYSLTVLLTDMCNLNCSFCFVQKGKNLMSKTIAHNRLREFIERYYSDSATLNFIFLGGEPLLNFSVLKDLVAYIEQRLSHGRYSIKVVTNGTQIDDEIRDWFNEHKHVRVAISTDNILVLQSARIKNCYSKIVLVPSHFASGVEDIIKKLIVIASAGYEIECVCADGVDWIYDKHAPILKLFFSRLRESFLRRPQLPPPNLLCCATWRINIKNEICRPGVNAFCVDPQGDLYACNRSSPMYNTGAFSLRFPLNSAPSLTDKCRECSVRSLCAICPAVRASVQNEDQARVKCLFSHESMLSSVLYQGNLVAKARDGDLTVGSAAFFTRRSGLSIEVVARGCVDLFNALSQEGWLHD